MINVIFLIAIWSSTVFGQYVSSATLPGPLSGNFVETDLFRTQSGLRTTVSNIPFNCADIEIFEPTFTGLGANIPEFKASTSHSCNYASLGPSLAAGSCRWVSQTFLGMMYDRGVELMRHNIPQSDAFQV
jgi:hypothetical protein